MSSYTPNINYQPSMTNRQQRNRPPPPNNHRHMPLSFHPQQGFTTHGNYNYSNGFDYQQRPLPPQTSFYPPQQQISHWHYSNSNRQGKPIPNKPNNTIGSQLFFGIKNYANNLYSSKLMKYDLDLNLNSFNKTKEYRRILDSLNCTQVQLRQPGSTKQQWTKVERLAQQLCVENTRLSLLEYDEKRMEILADINKCLKQKMRYIPSSEKVLNYVLPNMRKRRLFDQIFPHIKSDMKQLIGDLCKINGFKDTPEKGMHLPISDSNIVMNNVPPSTSHQQGKTIRKSYHSSISSLAAVPLHIGRNTVQCPMDVANDMMNPKKRLRDVDSDITYSPCSSMVDITQTIDGDIVNDQPRASIKRPNIVKTVDEAFTKMKTYIPGDHLLPSFSKSPETPDIGILNEHNTHDMDKNLKDTLIQNSSLSGPHHSLVTLHGENTDMPHLITHVAVKITPETLGNERLLNKLPLETNILYEIYFTNETYLKFRDHLQDFIKNANAVNFPFIFTVPEANSNDLLQLLASTNLLEITHPFQIARVTTLTT
jgi:hypothetical protein